MTFITRFTTLVAALLIMVGASTVCAHEPAAHQQATPAVPLDDDCAALSSGDHKHEQHDPVMQALMQKCAAHDGDSGHAGEPPAAPSHDEHGGH